MTRENSEWYLYIIYICKHCNLIQLYTLLSIWYLIPIENTYRISNLTDLFPKFTVILLWVSKITVSFKFQKFTDSVSFCEFHFTDCEIGFEKFTDFVSNNLANHSYFEGDLTWLIHIKRYYALRMDFIDTHVVHSCRWGRSELLSWLYISYASLTTSSTDMSKA